MARTYLMSWIPSRRGWMKEFKGRKYTVSCRQLGTDETKEGSREAANTWWQKKQASLVTTAPKVSLEESFEAAMARIAGAGSSSVPEFLERLAREKTALNDLRQVLDSTPVANFDQAEFVGKLQTIADSVAGPSEETIAPHVARYVEMLRARVAAKQLSPDHADNVRVALYHWRDWVGVNSPLASIDASKVHEFYVWVLGRKDWSISYKKKVFAASRSFIRWLVEYDLCQLPKNLESKSFRFKGGRVGIPTWTPLEFRTLLDAVPGQLKLHLLLMANCGFTQIDISDLLDSEVNWTKGRITRKRSKTGDQANVPEVSYKLWSQTFAMLKKFRSGQEVCLQTRSGQKWVRKELKADGSLKSCDNIRSNFAHVQKRLKFWKSLKEIRKTSATMLESHPTYGRFVQHFLGHAPATLAGKHYAAPSGDLFDKAVNWLKDQYGV